MCSEKKKCLKLLEEAKEVYNDGVLQFYENISPGLGEFLWAQIENCRDNRTKSSYTAGLPVKMGECRHNLHKGLPPRLNLGLLVTYSFCETEWICHQRPPTGDFLQVLHRAESGDPVGVARFHEFCHKHGIEFPHFVGEETNETLLL